MEMISNKFGYLIPDWISGDIKKKNQSKNHLISQKKSENLTEIINNPDKSRKSLKNHPEILKNRWNSSKIVKKFLKIRLKS